MDTFKNMAESTQGAMTGVVIGNIVMNVVLSASMGPLI